MPSSLPPDPYLLNLQARGLLPPEIAAALAGAVLMVAAGALLRTLRPACFGLTSLPDDESRHFNLKT